MSKINEHHFGKFIDFFYDSTLGCIEFCTWKAEISQSNFITPSIKYPRTIGGWYNRLDSLKSDIKRLKNISGYICINPIHADLLARRKNSIGPIKKGEGTTEKDIVIFRNFLIDIDCERPAGVSATDAELQEAILVRDAILAGEEPIRANSIWGCSGNGAYILVRFDEQNDKCTKDAVKYALTSLANKYGKKGYSKGFVDTNTYAPNFHIGIPGTLKCKGSATEDRPFRFCTVDSP